MSKIMILFSFAYIGLREIDVFTHTHTGLQVNPKGYVIYKASDCDY